MPHAGRPMYSSEVRHFWQDDVPLSCLVSSSDRACCPNKELKYAGWMVSLDHTKNVESTTASCKLLASSGSGKYLKFNWEVHETSLDIFK